MYRLICYLKQMVNGKERTAVRLINDDTDAIKIITSQEFLTYVKKGMVCNMKLKAGGTIICTESDLTRIALEYKQPNGNIVTGDKLMVMNVASGLYKIVGYDGQVKYVDALTIMMLIQKGATFSNARIKMVKGRPEVCALQGYPAFKEKRLSPENKIKVLELLYAKGDLKSGYDLGVTLYKNGAIARAEEVFCHIYNLTVEERVKLSYELFTEYRVKSAIYLFKIEMKSVAPHYIQAYRYIRAMYEYDMESAANIKRCRRYYTRLAEHCKDAAKDNNKEAIDVLVTLYGSTIIKDKALETKYVTQFLGLCISEVGAETVIDKYLNTQCSMSNEDVVRLISIFEQLKVLKVWYYKGVAYLNAGGNDCYAKADGCCKELMKHGGSNPAVMSWVNDIRCRMQQMMR